MSSNKEKYWMLVNNRRGVIYGLEGFFEEMMFGLRFEGYVRIN